MSTVVHIVGTGTIGEPLIGLFADFGARMGVDEVTFHKRTPLQSDRAKLNHLMARGAKLAVHDDVRKDFQDLGHEVSFEADEALARASVVIDCTPAGNDNKEKWYNDCNGPRGFLAQGSEFDFGKPYARGINDRALVRGKDQFIQIVSCNTHNLSILIDTLALQDHGPDNLVAGRFVCMRRANDISQDSSFVPSPVVGSHKDERFGTHHARDAWHLFNTLGYDLDLFSSAVKLNTQYMHAIYFDIHVKRKTTVDELVTLMRKNDRVAVTYKQSANAVFSFGRDQGHFGRILNVTVVALPTLAVRNGTEIVGYCFTPQDGNSLLSSVSAATWLLYPDDYEQRVQCLKPYFYDEV
jgi:glyceraldehyde-3-phosphate dehydrogenase (NAD(P))